MISLLDAVPYLRAYSGQIFVVKAGGELLSEPRWRDGIARDLAVLHRMGIRVVFVHGGGPQLDTAADRNGLGNRRVAGRRVTSAPLLQEAIREWRGLLSTEMVSALLTNGEEAVGLSGVDAGMLKANRRPPAMMTDDSGERVSVDYGEVGDIKEVSTRSLQAVFDIPAIPVVSPLAVTDYGEVLNVNADTVAAEIAIALGAAKLIVLTRAPGILADLEKPESVLHWTDLEELGRLESEGALLGGMRPKVAAIRRAIEGGVARAHVVDGREKGALLEEVFTTDGSGTLVVQRATEAPEEPL